MPEINQEANVANNGDYAMPGLNAAERQEYRAHLRGLIDQQQAIIARQAPVRILPHEPQPADLNWDYARNAPIMYEPPRPDGFDPARHMAINEVPRMVHAVQPPYNEQYGIFVGRPAPPPEPPFGNNGPYNDAMAPPPARGWGKSMFGETTTSKPVYKKSKIKVSELRQVVLGERTIESVCLDAYGKLPQPSTMSLIMLELMQQIVDHNRGTGKELEEGDENNMELDW